MTPDTIVGMLGDAVDALVEHGPIRQEILTATIGWAGLAFLAASAFVYWFSPVIAGWTAGAGMALSGWAIKRDWTDMRRKMREAQFGPALTVHLPHELHAALSVLAQLRKQKPEELVKEAISAQFSVASREADA
jgi:hypothetical protein